MTRLKVICQIFAWQRARSLFDGQRNGKRKYDFRQKLEALNVEGMVMKRKDSVYAFSRCRDWLKVKTAAGR